MLAHVFKYVFLTSHIQNSTSSSSYFQLFSSLRNSYIVEQCVKMYNNRQCYKNAFKRRSNELHSSIGSECMEIVK